MRPLFALLLVFTISAVFADDWSGEVLNGRSGFMSAARNVKIALNVPRELRQNRWRADNFRVWVYPATLAPQVGKQDRYAAKNVFLWNLGNLLFLDARTLPPFENYGDYRTLVEVAAPAQNYAVNPAGAVTHLPEKTDVVLLIDASFSMTRTDPDKKRVRAAEAFLQLAARDGKIGRVAVVAFNEAPRVLAGLTAPQAPELSPALARVGAQGMTNIGKALNQAADLLRDSPRAAVVLLTDGKNESVRYADEHLRLAREHTPVYAIGLSEQTDEEMLRAIAETTGGRSYWTADSAELTAIYLDVAAELGQQATLYSAALRGEQIIDLPVDATVEEITFLLDNPQAEFHLLPPPDATATPLDYEHRDFIERRVVKPMPGLWRARVKSDRPAKFLVTAKTAFYLDVFPPVATPRGWVLGATLADRGLLVDNSQVVVSSGGERFDLFDDGAHYDGDTNDGVYAGLLPFSEAARLSDARIAKIKAEHGNQYRREALITAWNKNFELLEQARGEVDFGVALAGSEVVGQAKIFYEGRAREGNLRFTEMTLRADGAEFSVLRQLQVPRFCRLQTGENAVPLKLKVAADLAAGDYRGELKVTADGLTFALPVTLTVKQPALALAPSEFALGYLDPEQTTTLTARFTYDGPRPAPVQIAVGEQATVKTAVEKIAAGDDELTFTFAPAKNLNGGDYRLPARLRVGNLTAPLWVNFSLPERGAKRRTTLAGHESRLPSIGEPRQTARLLHELLPRPPTREIVARVYTHELHLRSAPLESSALPVPTAPHKNWLWAAFCVLGSAIILLCLRRVVQNRFGRFALLSAVIHLPLLGIVAAYFFPSAPPPREPLRAMLVTHSEAAALPDDRPEFSASPESASPESVSPEVELAALANPKPQIADAQFQVPASALPSLPAPMSAPLIRRPSPSAEQSALAVAASAATSTAELTAEKKIARSPEITAVAATVASPSLPLNRQTPPAATLRVATPRVDGSEKQVLALTASRDAAVTGKNPQKTLAETLPAAENREPVIAALPVAAPTRAVPPAQKLPENNLPSAAPLAVAPMPAIATPRYENLAPETPMTLTPSVEAAERGLATAATAEKLPVALAAAENLGTSMLSALAATPEEIQRRTSRAPAMAAATPPEKMVLPTPAPVAPLALANPVAEARLTFAPPVSTAPAGEKKSKREDNRLTLTASAPPPVSTVETPLAATAVVREAVTAAENPALREPRKEENRAVAALPSPVAPSLSVEPAKIAPVEPVASSKVRAVQAHLPQLPPVTLPRGATPAPVEPNLPASDLTRVAPSVAAAGTVALPPEIIEIPAPVPTAPVPTASVPTAPVPTASVGRVAVSAAALLVEKRETVGEKNSKNENDALPFAARSAAVVLPPESPAPAALTRAVAEVSDRPQTQPAITVVAPAARLAAATRQPAVNSAATVELPAPAPLPRARDHLRLSNLPMDNLQLDNRRLDHSQLMTASGEPEMTTARLAARQPERDEITLPPPPRPATIAAAPRPATVNTSVATLALDEKHFVGDVSAEAENLAAKIMKTDYAPAAPATSTAELSTIVPLNAAAADAQKLVKLPPPAPSFAAATLPEDSSPAALPMGDAPATVLPATALPATALPATALPATARRAGGVTFAALEEAREPRDRYQTPPREGAVRLATARAATAFPAPTPNVLTRGGRRGLGENSDNNQSHWTGVNFSVGLAGTSSEQDAIRRRLRQYQIEPVKVAISANELRGCGAALIAEKADFSRAEIAQLQNYLRDGGRLWLHNCGGLPLALGDGYEVETLPDDQRAAIFGAAKTGVVSGLFDRDGQLVAFADDGGEQVEFLPSVLNYWAGGNLAPQSTAAAISAPVWQNFSGVDAKNLPWQIEKWSNPATVGLSSDGAGGEALHLRMTGGDGTRTAVSYLAPDGAGRRVNLRGKTAHYVDVYNAGDPLPLSLSLTNRTPAGWDEFETAPVTLQRGWNRGVKFSFAPVKSRRGATAISGLADCAKITYYLHTRAAGDLLFDNLRFQ
ncbi:MAG: VWA domain-containing protein [Planctomycetota bacterium]|jgi:uncharacterized protein YegL|nr:VWA domain-containing protein [Planctomycetota bacterium]